MNKFWVALGITFGLMGCSQKNEQYYLTHPKELQIFWKKCSEEGSKSQLCAQIEPLAQRMRQLAYELQSNPQLFGAKIMSLQEKIADQKLQSKAKPEDLESKKSLSQNQQSLQEYLAVVQWLESPES